MFYLEILLAAILAGLTGPLFLYGIKTVARREILASRFQVQKYNPEEDRELAKAKELAKRKKEIPASRYAILLFTGGVFFGGLVYLVVGTAWAALGGSFLGLIIPRLWLKWQKAGYERLISNQMEQAVEIMAAVLRSGGGITSALDKAQEKTPNPLKRELERAAGEIKLGVPVAQAFKNIAGRVAIPEMSMLSLAVNLQETGMAVNMAGVFDQIQANIRSRQAFSEEVKVITSENKLAGWVVALIPFGTVSLVRQLAPDFIAPLFTTTIGLAVFTSSGVMIGIGVFWIMQMARAETI